MSWTVQHVLTFHFTQSSRNLPLLWLSSKKWTFSVGDFLRLEMPLDNWFRLLNLLRKYARQAAIFLVEKNWPSFIACSFISGIWNCVSPREFEQNSRPRFRVICLHGQCKYCSHLTHTHATRNHCEVGCVSEVGWLACFTPITLKIVNYLLNGLTDNVTFTVEIQSDKTYPSHFFYWGLFRRRFVSILILLLFLCIRKKNSDKPKTMVQILVKIIQQEKLAESPAVNMPINELHGDFQLPGFSWAF